MIESQWTTAQIDGSCTECNAPGLPGVDAETGVLLDPSHPILRLNIGTVVLRLCKQCVVRVARTCFTRPPSTRVAVSPKHPPQIIEALRNLKIDGAEEDGPQQASPDPIPIPMLLWCPSCGTRHVDQGELATKPHHTHACQGCGMVWRPALVPTVGVRFLPGFKDEEPVQIAAPRRDMNPAHQILSGSNRPEDFMGSFRFENCEHPFDFGVFHGGPSLYPVDWPPCPGCGEPALDGHITCGRSECDEGGHRHGE